MQRISREWVIVLVSAVTDGALVFATALPVAMMASGVAEMPSGPVLIITSCGALAAFGRTIQNALKGDQFKPQDKERPR